MKSSLTEIDQDNLNHIIWFENDKDKPIKQPNLTKIDRKLANTPKSHMIWKRPEKKIKEIPRMCKSGQSWLRVI